MTSHVSEVAVTAWTRLVRGAATALDTIERRLKLAGLPGLEWYDVLLELDRTEALRPRELRSSLLMTQPNLSRLVDRLVAEGLIERRDCPDDRRGHLLSITDAGRLLRRAMWPAYAAGIEEAISANLSEADLMRLSALLKPLSATAAPDVADKH